MAGGHRPVGASRGRHIVRRTRDYAGARGGGGLMRVLQSRAGSLAEAVTNVVVGYGAALLTQWLVFPLFGIATTIRTDVVIAAVFTVVSLARSYALRRLFER